MGNGMVSDEWEAAITQLWQAIIILTIAMPRFVKKHQKNGVLCEISQLLKTGN